MWDFAKWMDSCSVLVLCMLTGVCGLRNLVLDGIHISSFLMGYLTGVNLNDKVGLQRQFAKLFWTLVDCYCSFLVPILSVLWWVESRWMSVRMSVIFPSTIKFRRWRAIMEEFDKGWTEWWSASVVVCLEQSADLHMAQLMQLPLTVSCFSKIQIGVTFLVPAHPGSPGKRTVKRVCVCVDKGCSEFCVIVGTVTRTAGILIHIVGWRLKTLAVNLSQPSGQLWLYAGLIGSNNPRWLKAP